MYFRFINSPGSPLFMTQSEKDALLTEYFSRYISEHKKNFIEKVLEQRTRYITIVLEDIYQSQNASAVVRTCECMGLQDVHIVENSSKYMVNRRVLKGSYKWVDLIRHKSKDKDNTAGCFQQLRKAGYKIAVTDPSPDGISIHEVPISDKIAIVMGNELRGTSSTAIEQADMKVNIPMYGFTESLNISVSAAICINSLLERIKRSSIQWSLTENEKNDVRLRWMRKMIRNVDILEREFLKTIH
jgi:tRNA (guanosine-2'-O-)-methyltransferase